MSTYRDWLTYETIGANTKDNPSGYTLYEITLSCGHKVVHKARKPSVGKKTLCKSCPNQTSSSALDQGTCKRCGETRAIRTSGLCTSCHDHYTREGQANVQVAWHIASMATPMFGPPRLWR